MFSRELFVHVQIKFVTAANFYNNSCILNNYPIKIKLKAIIFWQSMSLSILLRKVEKHLHQENEAKLIQLTANEYDNEMIANMIANIITNIFGISTMHA